ncbi:type II toxin-antitoxin system VapC family toxin [Enterovirga rhinocerotis]|uniref:PIN domain nuclease of toxin-antitoxin system n=1 Tax=Enterovirga rhinocerotis TaxID=1339210 RepID=A0A4R7C8Q1_9HYPH|nr:type II toxin-antitoxin system VapC family toxin [Enterovirga rhinocerotis]TDR94761.1 PIN domain nuclease of toxin-antitoxin system [Enterovirga rhinocerotis]
MQLLLDTHILLWAAEGADRLPAEARSLMAASENTLVFSSASLWEVAIKSALGRPDFRLDPGVLLRRLIDNGYRELPISGRHAVSTAALPAFHKDPFDRLLFAQAKTEGIVLLTADAALAEYGSPVRLV